MRMIGPFSAVLIIFAAMLTGLALGLVLGSIWLPTLTELCVAGLLLGVVLPT